MDLSRQYFSGKMGVAAHPRCMRIAFRGAAADLFPLQIMNILAILNCFDYGKQL